MTLLQPSLGPLYKASCVQYHSHHSLRNRQCRQTLKKPNAWKSHHVWSLQCWCRRILCWVINSRLVNNWENFNQLLSNQQPQRTRSRKQKQRQSQTPHPLHDPRAVASQYRHCGLHDDGGQTNKQTNVTSSLCCHLNTFFKLKTTTFTHNGKREKHLHSVAH